MIPVMLLVQVDRPVWGIIGGATIVVAVGLFDDLYELEPIVKFIGQLLAIGVAIYFDTRMTRIGRALHRRVMWHLPLVVSVLLTGFWMAMIINMVNFIDGLDGLAAGVCGISALTFAIISLATQLPGDGRARRRARRGDVRLPALQLPPGVHLHGRRRVDAARLRARLHQRAERDEGHCRGRPGPAAARARRAVRRPVPHRVAPLAPRRAVLLARPGPRAPRPRAGARLLAAQERAAAVLAGASA